MTLVDISSEPIAQGNIDNMTPLLPLRKPAEGKENEGDNNAPVTSEIVKEEPVVAAAELQPVVRTKRAYNRRPKPLDEFGNPLPPPPKKEKVPRKPKKSHFSDDENGDPVDFGSLSIKRLARANIAKLAYVRPQNPLDFDPNYVYDLARQYPDEYWAHHAESKSGMLNKINEDHPLKLVDCHIHDQAPITGMIISPDGSILVTFCNYGSVKLWSLDDYSLLKTLRDAKEPHIDEFYVGSFVPDQTMILVGGKLKDRNHWSEADEDNNILPCPLKLFDVITGEVVTLLRGHAEELLCVKRVQFKGQNFFLSGSQDGYLNKWHMSSDWKTLDDMSQMEDGVTCMAFTVSFVPNTGNKFFLAAADENLRLYDFEHAVLLQTFEGMYSSYCDCGKFITAIDFPMPPSIFDRADSSAESPEEDKKGKGKAVAVEVKSPSQQQQQFAYFISRGVELLDSEERMIAKDYNSCTLHKLVYPDSKGGKWYLTEVKRFQDEEYFSNAWLMKIASNGRYMMAPTCTGEVFIFNLKTGQVTGVLKDHDDVEVRDVIFHQTRPLLLTSGDDGQVKVYTYENQSDLDRAHRDRAESERKAAEATALMKSIEAELSTVSVTDEMKSEELVVDDEEILNVDGDVSD